MGAVAVVWAVALVMAIVYTSMLIHAISEYHTNINIDVNTVFVQDVHIDVKARAWYTIREVITCHAQRRKSAVMLPIIGGRIVSLYAQTGRTARRYAPPLPLLVSRCKLISSKLALSACSATASRLQHPTQLETTRPHDNTPTGRRSPGLFIRFNPLPSHALQGWQGGTRCGMLDIMI